MIFIGKLLHMRKADSDACNSGIAWSLNSTMFACTQRRLRSERVEHRVDVLLVVVAMKRDPQARAAARRDDAAAFQPGHERGRVAALHDHERSAAGRLGGRSH